MVEHTQHTRVSHGRTSSKVGMGGMANLGVSAAVATGGASSRNSLSVYHATPNDERKRSKDDFSAAFIM